MNNIGAHRRACQRQIKTYSRRMEGEVKETVDKNMKKSATRFSAKRHYVNCFFPQRPGPDNDEQMPRDDDDDRRGECEPLSGSDRRTKAAEHLELP